MTHACSLVALLSLLLVPSCGESTASGPGLSIRPVELGEKHASVLGTILGPMQAYELRYTGTFESYRVTAETIRNGEVVETVTLGAGGCAPDVDMLLGLVALEPRREGDSTDMTFVLSTGGAMYHKDTLLETWDGLKGEGEGTSFLAWNEPRTADIVDGEPIGLWRWSRGVEVPLQQSLGDAPDAEIASVLQISISFQ